MKYENETPGLNKIPDVREPRPSKYDVLSRRFWESFGRAFFCILGCLYLINWTMQVELDLLRWSFRGGSLYALAELVISGIQKKVKPAYDEKDS